MIFREKSRKTIRERKLEWHFHEILISQKELEDGCELKGYGVIKTHTNGSLYLDFICLESNKKSSFMGSIPEDSMDDKQVVSLNAIGIDGLKIESHGLRVETSLQDALKLGPVFYRINLSEINIIEENDPDDTDKSFFHMEFNEKVDIPKNKINKTESTLEGFSSSWNQSILKYLDVDINIIHHDQYTEIYANGSGVDFDLLRNAVTFYVGFSSGAFIQPYIEYRSGPEVTKTTIYSIDSKKIKKRIPAPICDFVLDQDKQEMDHLHFELFGHICNILDNNPSYFESIYSQWKRIWNSFLSPEISVTMLTTSVAIEGVLNDIFIPVVANLLKDEELEEEKKRILLIIESVDDLSKDHSESIKNFVSKWGNIHPKKLLDYLVSIEVIEKRHVKNWTDLRNSSAHPKLMVDNEGRRRKDIGRLIVCLGLFYRLALNVFSYKGAQYAYEKPKDSKLITYKPVNVLY